LKRLFSQLLFVLALLVAARAQALPGLDGIRWQTQFVVPGGGYATADLTVDDWQWGSIYPSGYGNPDGSLQITSYNLLPSGLTNGFAGTWSRGGDGGAFNFSVVYENGEAVRLNGYYSGGSTGSMMLRWNGYR
jgi:hypothetical protein